MSDHGLSFGGSSLPAWPKNATLAGPTTGADAVPTLRTLVTADLPAGTGTVTSISVATANGVSGSVANPTTTPAVTLTLGAITPSSVNGLTITTSTGTLTVANGKTLTASNTLTLTGTDGSTLAIGTGGTLGSAAYTASSAYLAAAPILTTFAALANAAGWLHNDGAGVLVYSAPSKSDVGLGSVENTALSTWAGTANITTLGTIATGTWHGGVIAAAYGGTGVANSSTITIGGNVTLSGAYTFTGTLTANTAITLPAAGTVVSTAAATSSAATITGSGDQTLLTRTIAQNELGTTKGRRIRVCVSRTTGSGNITWKWKVNGTRVDAVGATAGPDWVMELDLFANQSASAQSATSVVRSFASSTAISQAGRAGQQFAVDNSSGAITVTLDGAFATSSDVATLRHYADEYLGG